MGYDLTVALGLSIIIHFVGCVVFFILCIKAINSEEENKDECLIYAFLTFYCAIMFCINLDSHTVINLLLK